MKSLSSDEYAEFVTWLAKQVYGFKNADGDPIYVDDLADDILRELDIEY